MVKSAYIHIPFCKSKCGYCSFVSFCNLDLKKEYLKFLAKEINYFYEDEVLNTLYFGGGTPSLLTVGEFENILRRFRISDKTEITTELNPDDVSYDYLRRLYDLGINRLSFGCQTFSDEVLKLINRRHSCAQVIEAVEFAQRAGFRNVSLDFIYGLPNQTLDSFLADLRRGVNLGVSHISLYGLKIEEGSFFYDNPPMNLPDDDEQADMYLAAVEFLTGLGFEHYEVSNFSHPGCNSRHNLTYWNNDEYYGFGLAAHGYKNGTRYANFDTFEEYFNKPFERKETKLLTVQEKLEEEIFLGFRRMNGINLTQINDKFGIDFFEKYNKVLDKYEGLNLLEKTLQGYKLTPNGVLVSNVILADFLTD
ncbi:MAG: radical SAM family heme chaperone HemW [Muribaculaceae bacterium]|nr:radical SAM family heme chaperone HemW [Muribaculaceae bacterium]